MADDTKQQSAGGPTPDAEETVVIPVSTLSDIQSQLAKLEQQVADGEAARAGLEAMVAESTDTNALGEKKIREKKSFEPKFRTVRLRRYPIAGDHTNLGWVIGWTNRGAFQEIDRTGTAPQYVDYIEVFFLGNDRTETGALKAEKIKLLDLLNKGEQVTCKIVNMNRREVVHPTGEELHVTTFDPQHGLIDTGETVDGFYAQSEIKYTVEVPGHGQVEIDGEFVN